MHETATDPGRFDFIRKDGELWFLEALAYLTCALRKNS